VSATISVAMASESHGWVMAVIPPEDRYVMGGTVEFKAWLFPLPGGALRVSTHCDAVTAASPDVLRDKLQKRADKGRWWERGAA
jgi:hypothetical protein